VRLQGVNSPELHPTPKPYAVAARDFTTAAIKQQVELSFDSHCGGTAASCRDIYNRILAYVKLNNGSDLGEDLLNQGLAKVYIYHHEAFDKIAEYKTIEKRAKRANVGLWSH
jgi:endonuclease YncB( thermonuclease family)